MKQVLYFYEGETEKKLLTYLKNRKLIKAGKTKKFNLWKGKVNTNIRTFNKDDEIFFIIDTDDISSVGVFKDNIKILQSYNICLIMQCKNLEDELCFACNKPNKNTLFLDFYQTTSKDKFKSNFIKDKDIAKRLDDNKFKFSKLWSKNTDFIKFLNDNNIEVNHNCGYKE